MFVPKNAYNILYLSTVNYIRNVDGLTGCYRGLLPKLIGNILGSAGSERVARCLGFEADLDDDKNDEILSDDA